MKLLTAILMSLAAVAWVASAVMIPPGEDTMMRWLIAAAFAVLAAIYWISYFRSKKLTSGTE